MKVSCNDSPVPEKKINRNLRLIKEIFKWFIAIGLRKNAISCWMSCWGSVSLFFSIISLICCIIIFLVTFFFVSGIGYIFTIIPLFISLILMIFLVNFLKKETEKGKKLFIQYPEWNSEVNHHGIALIDYIKPKSPDFSLLPIFIEAFQTKIPYKIYLCKNKRDFLNLYYNKKIQYLWILGHGDRGGFFYGNCTDQEYVLYSNRLPQKSIHFIAQLHCNAGDGQTLAELNSLTSDHDTHHLRILFQNRHYIKTKVRKFLNEETFNRLCRKPSFCR